MSRLTIKKIVFILLVLPMASALCFRSAEAQSEADAYEHNRQGMIAMSKAEFDEAVSEFESAAALATDYQIIGRALVYTPVFMTGWAHEKVGRIGDACREYRRFLVIAPPERVEETKVEHVRDYLKLHCS